MKTVEFKEYLNQVVTSKNIKHETISREFGLPITTVSRWLEGRSAPHPAVRQQVVDFLDRLP